MENANECHNFKMRTTILKCLLLGAMVQLSTQDKHLNVTMLANCDETGMTIPMHLTEVSYEIDPSNGYCTAIHGKFTVETADQDAKDLNITFYRCADADPSKPCLDNYIEHYEELVCDRFMNDDTGPWHMFRESISGGHCGATAGNFDINFATLQQKHLSNYIDVNEPGFNKFRVKILYYRIDTAPITVRACVTIDFTYI